MIENFVIDSIAFDEIRSDSTQMYFESNDLFTFIWYKPNDCEAALIATQIKGENTSTRFNVVVDSINNPFEEEICAALERQAAREEQAQVIINEINGANTEKELPKPIEFPLGFRAAQSAEPAEPTKEEKPRS